jgi:hypothetical protein
MKVMTLSALTPDGDGAGSRAEPLTALHLHHLHQDMDHAAAMNLIKARSRPSTASMAADHPVSHQHRRRAGDPGELARARRTIRDACADGILTVNRSIFTAVT